MKAEKNLNYCICSFIASHRLQCFIAVTPGLNFTIFELDGEKIFNCDSNSKKLIPVLECIKSDADEPEFRESVKSKIWAEYDDLQHRVDETVEASNHTEGEDEHGTLIVKCQLALWLRKMEYSNCVALDQSL